VKKFTIIMLYPDYLAHNYGEETYVAHVESEDLQLAIRAAQLEASKANAENETVRPVDFAVIFACDGHIDDLLY